VRVSVRSAALLLRPVAGSEEAASVHHGDDCEAELCVGFFVCEVGAHQVGLFVGCPGPLPPVGGEVTACAKAFDGRLVRDPLAGGRPLLLIQLGVSHRLRVPNP